MRRSRGGILTVGCLILAAFSLAVVGLAVSGYGIRLLDRLQGVGAAPAASPRTPIRGEPAATPQSSASPRPTPGAPAGAAQPTPLPPQPPPGPPTATPPPSAPVALEYFKAWEQRRYADMYALLSPSARASIDEKRFVGRYTAILDAATVTGIAVAAGQPQPGVLPNTARVPFDVALKTIRLGEIKEANTLPLTFEEGRWGVQWSPSLIFKDLAGDNLIRMYPLNPQRGSILDRQGRPLATQGYVVQVGVVPGEIRDEAALLRALSDYTKLPADQIKRKYAKAEADWFVPIKDMPTSQEDEARQRLEQVDGVMLRHKSVRIYPNGEVGANVVGYVSRITAEDLQKLASKGYDAEDVVGREGVEAWAEEQLSGQRGGKLAVVSPAGEVVKVIAEQPVRRGADVHLTLDVEIQRKAEEVLGDKTPGSIVVLDPRENAILALATYPRYDPNKFVQGLSEAEWEKLSSDPRYPMLNRPALSAYASGSIFKVVPFSAAMEKLGYKADAPTPCPGSWTIPGTSISLRDWKPEGHGVLPFPQTLTESCNAPFYDIGYKLNTIDPSFLPSWARLFGLGQKPGTAGLDEAAGIVPDPAWKQRVVGQGWFPGDAVNLAIGQGFFQATPLQMANVYSTIANGGALRSPVLIRKIALVDGQLVRAFAAEEKGRVPLQPATLRAIRDGLGLTGPSPNGTAYYAFSSFRTPLASKTGSAENQGPTSHAWFVGYAPLDTPEVLVVVMGEGGGAGGTVAAPRGRLMMDYFFPGSPPAPGIAPAPAPAPTPTVRATPVAGPPAAPKPAASPTAAPKPVASPTPTPRP